MKEGSKENENIHERLMIGDDHIGLFRIKILPSQHLHRPERVEPDIKARPETGIFLQDPAIGIEKIGQRPNQAGAQIENEARKEEERPKKNVNDEIDNQHARLFLKIPSRTTGFGLQAIEWSRSLPKRATGS
jgi:hypothetical protein